MTKEKQKIRFTVDGDAGFLDVIYNPEDRTLEIRSWGALRIIPRASNVITVYEKDGGCHVKTMVD